MTEFQVTVATADLREALQAVSPHAEPDAKLPRMHRIRLDIGDVNINVTATNGFSAALAIVSVDEYGQNENDHRLDLSPLDVKEILALFKAGGGSGDEDEPDDSLRIEVADDATTFTDVSGLFEGKALTLPRYPVATDFPDVSQVIYTHLTRTKQKPDRVITSGKLLALFGAAPKAYGQPLVIEPTGERTGLLLACGESFLGVLMPQKPDEERVAELNNWRRAWMRRFEAQQLAMEPEVD